MKRVELLNSGVWLFINSDNKTAYNVSAEQMDEDTQRKVALLRATDVHTRIDGIGTRTSDCVYWLFEEGDDDDVTFAFMLNVAVVHNLWS